METFELFHAFSQLDGVRGQESINHQHSLTAQVSNLKYVRIVIELVLYLFHEIGGDATNAIGEQ